MGLKEGTLRSLVLHGCSVPAHELANTFFHHMLPALGFLSAYGIIHRDLKPDNILYMSGQGGYHFQLGGFGLSNRQALAETHAGSPVYMGPEVHYGGKQSPKADFWSLFVTILWTLDAGGFRQLGGTFSTYDQIKKTVLSLANMSELSRAREMARVDPSVRASAAQMLVRCFGGEGLTTPRSQIPPIVDSAEHGADPPGDVKGKAPAAVPADTNTTGCIPVADINTESPMSPAEKRDSARATVRAAKERPAPRAAKPLGIAKNQPWVPRRGFSRQTDPVDVLLRQPAPSWPKGGFRESTGGSATARLSSYECLPSTWSVP
jgi:serine/threonine protein kinase